jgi:hypothetical protein
MSGPVSTLLEELREALEQRLPQALITTQYPFQQRKLPPDQPVVWLGVEKIAVPGSGFAPYLGEEPAQGGQPAASAMGREVELGLRADILDRYDGDACHQLFGELCQFFMLEEGRPWVRDLSCGSLAFDRDAGAFRLTCRGNLRAFLLYSEEALPILDIIVKKEESQ